MGRYLQLKELIEATVGPDVKVYFQPPESFKMVYPCVVFKKDGAEVAYADNLPYRPTKRWEVTVIDRDPDSSIPDKVQGLPYSSFNRNFVVDELNHDIYSLYF